jgi:hypothetical protein
MAEARPYCGTEDGLIPRQGGSSAEEPTHVAQRVALRPVAEERFTNGSAFGLRVCSVKVCL